MELTLRFQSGNAASREREVAQLRIPASEYCGACASTLREHVTAGYGKIQRKNWVLT